MSLLWKKPKSGRLSRFMSEFHKSPKLGRIMVVETGFPTSLIDLFFKNRDRPKKYATKTKRIQRLIETAPIASLPVNPDVSLEKPVTRRSKIEKVRRKHTSENNVCVCGDGTGAFVLMAFKLFIVASGGATPWSGGSHDPHGFCRNKIFACILEKQNWRSKLAPPLIVAVLALSTTKSLTMGIALCAFALLFTENVATRILTRLKLCNTDARKEKPLASTHDDKLISCSEETETIAVTNNSNSNDSRIRDDLSLKDEKVRSKSSRLKSKILKKLRSYKKKKDKTIVVNQVKAFGITPRLSKKKKKKKTIVVEEETLTDASSVVPEDKSDVIESERDDQNSNPPLIESKGDNMNGIVVIVIVLTGLLSGKMIAIGLTISCMYLGFGAAKKSGLFI
ncbi:uncharacterized protein LOC130511151 [Raphanus sativus]|uniref:Uncharacterized protein LOC130511151 n=1 Tax=Raphanus sativus TaxID=3726 RepID=A0A9W3DJR2_RAPSA|nr:uncharacterized protein LOC130511151 [Raphanus sativus]